MVKDPMNVRSASRRVWPGFAKPAVAGLVALAAASAWGAGQFQITPVRIFMQPSDRATAVTITNEGDEELVMQADVFEWKQKPGGEDELTPSEDLFLSPPIVKLAPKARQVVRLARVRPTPSAAQLSYRMIIREVPEVKSADQNVQVQFALAFSMPVFITPPGAKSQVDCTVERISRDTVRASCENRGNAYAQLRELSLAAPSGEKLASRDAGLYILPAVKRTVDLKRAEGPMPGGKATLAVTLDDGSTRTFDVTVAE